MARRRRIFRRILSRLRPIVAVPARVLAHLFLLPVDVLFLIFDIFFVNLKKTRLFRHDCRGTHGFPGGPCPPARKYTNRWLFRLVCADMAKTRWDVRTVCRAGERVRIHFVRGICALLAVVVIAVGANWAAIRFWPALETAPTPREAIDKLFAERVQKGDGAFAAERYDEALSLFQRALGLEPHNKELLYKAGLCFDELGQSEKAVQYFHDAAEGDDAFAAAANRMALYLYEMGDVGHAGTHAKRAIELGVDEGPTHAVLADRYVWSDDMQSAAAHLEIAMDKSPESGIVRLARAHLLIRQEEFDRAGELLDGIADDEAIARLAGIYRMEMLGKLGRREEAIEELERFAQRYPELARPLLLLVDAQFSVNRRQEALARAEELEEGFASSPGVRLELSRILGKHGQDGRALRIALSCAGREEFAVPAHVLAGNVYLRRGMPELAQVHARQALAKNSSNLPALLLSAKAALAMGEAEWAARRFHEAAEAAPESAEPWYLLGQAQRMSNNLELALESLSKACELRPNSGQFHHEYAVALLVAGKKAQAREQFLKAANLLPRPYDSYTRLGILAQEEGDRAKAQEYYVKALDADPRRAIIASNNLAYMLLSENKDVPLALAFAYLAYANSRGTLHEADISDTLAEALIKAGFPAYAVGAARHAARAEPDNPDRRFRLGLAEAAAGNVEEAITALEKAVEGDPNAEWAALARALTEKLKERREKREEETREQEAATG